MIKVLPSKRFRKTIPAISPPAFEVHGPNVVGPLCFEAVGQTARLGRGPRAALFREAGALQHALEAALAGGAGGSMLAMIKVLDFAGAPVRVGLLQTHDLADGITVERLGMPKRTAAFLAQAAEAMGDEALAPLVACLGADAVSAA